MQQVVDALTFTASISDRETAVQRSGRLEGGGRVYLDVPETDIAALATLMALARTPLRVTVEVLPADPLKTDDGRPSWARPKR